MWRKDNPERAKNKIREWRKNHPEKELEYRIKGAYNFTQKETKKILSWNGGKCAICPKILKKFGMGYDDACIEHNHKTQRFRGIVCGRCNRAMGIVLDNPNLLRKMILYLEKEG